jgi:type I site-specific restriction endonuclease
MAEFAFLIDKTILFCNTSSEAVLIYGTTTVEYPGKLLYPDDD